jgi:endonuclease YncB( thermonuclease family)
MKVRLGLAVGLLALALSVAWSGSHSLTSAVAGGDRDCSDFANQKKAQEFFNSHNPSADPHMLDGDGDGIACEDNPCPCSTAGPGGGGGGGRGPDPDPKPEPRKDHVRVVSVTDGDTIKVRFPGGRRRDVRLIGIDTPEVYGGQECGGPEASRSLKRKLAEGTRVLIISDSSQDNRDRYGRLLRYVEKRDKDMNKAQVRRGWAHVYVYGGNPFKRVEKVLDASSSSPHPARAAVATSTQTRTVTFITYSYAGSSRTSRHSQSAVPVWTRPDGGGMASALRLYEEGPGVIHEGAGPVNPSGHGPRVVGRPG